MSRHPRGRPKTATLLRATSGVVRTCFCSWSCLPIPWPTADIGRHGHVLKMMFRTRHQQQAIDCVVLYAPETENALDLTQREGDLGVVERGVCQWLVALKPSG